MKNLGFSVLLAVLGGSVTMAQDSNLDDRVKAAFILNFIQYAEWPSAAISPDGPFTLCIAGDSFMDLMGDTVRGETANGHAINVRNLDQPANAAACQLIYFRESANRQTALDILNAAKTLPILTVGEVPDFLRAGGIVRFTRVENRIRFEINPEAAERVSLSISSRLLRLAEIVRPQ